SILATMSIRSRDLTPNTGGAYEKDMLGEMGLANHGFGGGPKFLEFLLDELKPLIDDTFAVDPHDSIIAGCSLGGLFLTWVLFNKPGSFTRYICISPAIWWNKEEVWQWEENFAANNDDLKAQVFFTAGGLETVEKLKVQMVNSPMTTETVIKLYDEHGWPRMAEITPEITAKLKSRAYPSLEIHCFNMPDETHMSVAPPALTRGLRVFFGHWQVPTA
ncbi:MAG: alpha/beta hydrolase, partial [Deltaproteobacteria bacterium]|nr:alpha/beta hydrolase [Deltaproteobacteria bacterium]